MLSQHEHITIHNQAAHWTPFLTQRSWRQGKHRNKNPKPSSFFQRGSAQCCACISCIAQWWLLIERNRNEKGGCAGVSLLALKRCLKKSCLGSSICKGYEATSQEADNAYQLNSNHLQGLGGSEACAPPGPAPAAPQHPCRSSHIRRPIGTQQGRLQTIGWEKKKGQKVLNLQGSLFLST